MRKNLASLTPVFLALALTGCQSSPKGEQASETTSLPNVAANSENAESELVESRDNKSTRRVERKLPRPTAAASRGKKLDLKLQGRRNFHRARKRAANKAPTQSATETKSNTEIRNVSTLSPVKESGQAKAALIPQSPQNDPNWLYALGRAAYLRRKYGKAQQLLSKAIDRSPNVGEYFFRRALCYACLDKHDNAGEDYRRAVQLNPKYQEDLRLADEFAVIYRKRALESIATGREASVVIVDFKRAASLNPLSPDLDSIPSSLLDRVRQDAKNRNNTRALADSRFIRENFEDTISLNSVSEVYIQRGGKAMTNQIYSSAKREFQYALAVEPNQPKIRDLIFECERLLRDPDTQKRAKKFKGNVEDLAGVDINPINYRRFVDTLRDLQRRRSKMKNKPVEEQKMILRQAKDLENRIWKAAIDAANETFRENKVEEAHEHVVLALSIAPSDQRKKTVSRKQIIGEEYSSLLVQKAKKLGPKKWREAKELMEKALTISPGFKSAKSWLDQRRARLSQSSETEDQGSGLDQFFFILIILTVISVLVYLLFGDTIMDLFSSSNSENVDRPLISQESDSPDQA